MTGKRFFRQMIPILLLLGISVNHLEATPLYICPKDANTNNQIVLDDKGYSINGVFFKHTGEFSSVVGGLEKRGVASNNSITINGGHVKGCVIGGTGLNANRNVVIVNGGVIDEGISGGEGVLFGDNDANAYGNTITINGGKIGGTIRASGFYHEDKTASQLGNSNLSDETINISGQPDLSKASFYYGSKNATMNIHTKELVAKKISGFPIINIYLPSTIKNGDTIFTIHPLFDEEFLIPHSMIYIGVEGKANLHVGDTVTLFKSKKLPSPYDDDAIPQGPWYEGLDEESIAESRAVHYAPLPNSTPGYVFDVKRADDCTIVAVVKAVP